MWFRLGSFSLAVGLSLIFFSLAGCGGRAADAPTLYPVSGSVSYKGAPVPGAKVMFMGDGTLPPAVGLTDSGGNFTLSSMAGSGAVAGRHIVVVQKETEAAAPEKVNMSMEEAAAAAQKPQTGATSTSLIPKKYTDPQSSPLSYEVTSGSNDFPIELTD